MHTKLEKKKLPEEHSSIRNERKNSKILYQGKPSRRRWIRPTPRLATHFNNGSYEYRQIGMALTH
jgi:hypothetical protein